MAMKVQTVAECDICGFEETRPWAEDDCPPNYWSEMVIRTRLPGSGWSNSERPFDGFICPGCQGRLMLGIADIRLRHPRGGRPPAGGRDEATV